MRSANAKPTTDGTLRVNLGDVTVETDRCALVEASPHVSHCVDEIHIHLTLGGARHSLLFTSLYLDSDATLYRGPLDATYKQNGHSFIVTDVDGDSHEDLIVWTGKAGAYGGPSYEVLLFDPADRQFHVAPSLSDLTVGANGLFRVDQGRLKLSSSDGCCIRVFETYVLEQGEPALVERVTDERDEATGKVTTRTERMVDGALQEVR